MSGGICRVQVAPWVCLGLGWSLEEAVEASRAVPRAQLRLVGCRVPERVMNPGAVQQELSGALAGNEKAWASMVTEVGVAPGVGPETL